MDIFKFFRFRKKQEKNAAEIAFDNINKIINHVEHKYHAQVKVSLSTASRYIKIPIGNDQLGINQFFNIRISDHLQKIHQTGFNIYVLGNADLVIIENCTYAPLSIMTCDEAIKQIDYYVKISKKKKTLVTYTRNTVDASLLSKYEMAYNTGNAVTIFNSIKNSPHMRSQPQSIDIILQELPYGELIERNELAIEYVQCFILRKSYTFDECCKILENFKYDKKDIKNFHFYLVDYFLHLGLTPNLPLTMKKIIKNKDYNNFKKMKIVTQIENQIAIPNDVYNNYLERIKVENWGKISYALAQEFESYHTLSPYCKKCVKTQIFGQPRSYESCIEKFEIISQKLRNERKLSKIQNTFAEVLSTQKRLQNIILR